MTLDRSKLILHREIRANKTCPGTRFDIQRLLDQTGELAPAQPTAVRTRSNVNVRRGAPSTSAPIVRVIPLGTVINVRGSVTGQPVNGISRWYQNVDGDYIWAGAIAD